MKALTEKQREVLKYVEWYQERFGDHPTYRDIQAALDLNSINSVVQFLKQLEKKEQIILVPNRGYRLIKFK